MTALRSALVINKYLINCEIFYDFWKEKTAILALILLNIHTLQ